MPKFELRNILQYVYTSVCSLTNTLLYSRNNEKPDKKTTIIYYLLTLSNNPMAKMETDLFPVAH